MARKRPTPDDAVPTPEAPSSPRRSSRSRREPAPDAVLREPVRKPKRGSRLSALERRAQLVEVGRSVFAKRGYEGTSVEEIAARAKVSKPIVYEHFGG
ncbi:MAG: helix-turn-helix transcriptional regulator, partial [Myxococcales bacterium]|nr:helix-turn-helix transcriptional regulator [Myxococcales bacterium]